MGIILPEINSLHLKMDGWNTIVSFWDGLFNLVSSVMLVLGSVDMNISKTKRHKRTRTINSKNDLRTVVTRLGWVRVKPVLKFPRKHVNLMAIGPKACVWRATA